MCGDRGRFARRHDRFRARRCGNVLWAAGVAASSLVKTLGVPLDRAGRVIVEPDLSIPGHPEVFVVGDAAAFTIRAESSCPESRRRRCRARVTRRRRSCGGCGVSPRSRSSIVTWAAWRSWAGVAAISDLGWVRLSGVTAWLAWLFLHIVMLIGFRNRVVVLFEWAVAYLTFQRGARLITGDTKSGDTVTDSKG